MNLILLIHCAIIISVIKATSKGQLWRVASRKESFCVSTREITHYHMCSYVCERERQIPRSNSRVILAQFFGNFLAAEEKEGKQKSLIMGCLKR